jgi:hypothetical protein
VDAGDQVKPLRRLPIRNGSAHQVRRRNGYVLAVACNQTIPTEGGKARADTLAARAPLN